MNLYNRLRPSYRWATKFWNTFLPRPSFDRVNDERFWAMQTLLPLPINLQRKVLYKLMRLIIPGRMDLNGWALQDIGQPYDPRNYVSLSPESFALIDEVVNRAGGLQSTILDLGCNCGRHLNALTERGFANLYGVDIGRKALDYMDVAFPGLSKHVHIICAPFQQFLLNTPPFHYEIVFTFGATVELVHPSFPLVKHLARVAQHYVILMINENGHSYPRFWEHEFDKNGFLLIKLLRPAVLGNNSLLVFQRCV